MAPENPFADEAFARRYAQKHQKMARSFGEEYARKLAARGFDQGTILDAGCGFGGTLLYLVQHFPQASGVGLDASEPLLTMARQAADVSGAARRVRFEQADVQAIPYPDDSFDVVISTNVVHHVPDPLGLLNELERVLTPQGMLYVADIRRSWLPALFDKSFQKAMSMSELMGLLSAAGWSRDWFTTGLLWWRYER
ncbi:MAG: class I SAM-dependent methyltransferase [Candidatus Promineifilaceae bacterium]|jgi:ubiquinone/menaquinone biosynthesis C-methylase UbiE